MHTHGINVLCIFYNKNMQYTSCTEWLGIFPKKMWFALTYQGWREGHLWVKGERLKALVSTGAKLCGDLNKDKRKPSSPASFSSYAFSQLMTTLVSSYGELNSRQQNCQLSFMHNQVPMNSFKCKSYVYSVCWAIAKFKAAHLNCSLKESLTKVEPQRGSLLNVCLLNNLWKSP